MEVVSLLAWWNHFNQRSHRDWTRPTFECLSASCGGLGECLGDRHSDCSRSGTRSVWHKPSWIRSPLAPPQSHWTDDPQTARQLYQRNFHTAKKVLGPTTDFPTWEFGKGTENPQGIWLWRPVEFDYRTSTGLGKQTLGGHKQNTKPCTHQDLGERSSDHTRNWPRCASECSGVSGGSMGWQ